MPGTVWGRVRNYLYDKGYLDIGHSSSFVISIGNLTWGGTGKTALAAQLAQWLISSGYRTAVISRGYGRKSRGFQVVSDGRRLPEDWQNSGDEPFWIAHRVPEAVVLVSEDRSQAIRFLEQDPPHVILLDDGFQNRRIARDLDLVLIDASESLLNQKVIPFGKLREPLDSLKRADALILSHSRASHPETLEWIAAHISVPIFHANYVLVSTDQEWQGKKVAAFCALGAPNHFFRMLKDHGADIVSRKKFRDHHPYTQEDLEEIQAGAIISGAEVLITTQKDAVKIKRSWFHLPFIEVESELRLEESQQFYDWIQERILAKRAVE